MKLLRILLPLLVLSIAIPATGAVVWEDGDKALKINYLLQTQFTMTEEGSIGTLDTNAADYNADDTSTHTYKDKTWGKDFFIRRSRILIGGNICKNISFFMETDQAKYGSGGAGGWSSAFFVQDAFMTFNIWKRMFMVDAGMIIVPFTRHLVQSAVSLNTVDYHGSLARYPETKVWRDMGVQFRGYLVNDKLQYRVGVFNGVEGKKVGTLLANGKPDPTAGANPDDMPRFTGRVMYNIMGKETGFYYGGMHFAKEPIISVGLAFDMQPDVTRDDKGELAPYMAYGGDLYVDYPIGPGELVAQANVAIYDNGHKAEHTGMGLFGEVGYRYQQVSLVGAFDMFTSDHENEAGKADKDFQQIQAGVNFWIKKHNANIKAAFTMTKEGVVEDKEGVVEDADYMKGLIVQGQFFF
jgi:hypothetical protein